MAVTTVLFDLDGTLLPMDQDAFVKKYFGLLAAFLAPKGYKPQELIESVWAGTTAMVKNNGEKTNEDVFWDLFSQRYGPDVRKDIPVFEAFYKMQFAGAAEACGAQPLAAEVIAKCKGKGLRVALATNPIFPAIATENRIRWAGLKPEDFEIVTTYENSRFSKPNPNYYKAIMEQMGVSAGVCLMVGNDVVEDMVAGTLGMQVFLLTDCLINKNNADISGWPNGNFHDLLRFLDEIS